MKEPVRIGPLMEADVERVSALAREIWLAHYPGIISLEQIEYMLAQRYDPARIRAELAQGGCWWDVLVTGGDIVGFASYFLADEPGTMKLDKVYVHPQHQRRGYGSLLIGHVRAKTARRGCRRLELAVNKNNRNAIAAYTKHGFKIRDAIVKDIGGGFVMDDYIMVREIA
ncbi:MAG: GNAT family N-acetyltransferase [Pseudomonadota bacterium]